MLLKNISDLSVIEFLTVAALERYQASWDQLIQDWFDRDYCRKVNRELDEIRKLVAALPQLSVDMVEVTMRHAQLLRALLKSAAPQRDSEIAALGQKHRTAIKVIRDKCLRFLAHAR